MFTVIYEMMEAAKGHGFRTTLPDSFIGILAYNFSQRGIKLLNIVDEGSVRKITTNLATVIMEGSFSALDVIRAHQRRTRIQGLTDELDHYAWVRHDRGYLSSAQKDAVSEIMVSLREFGKETRDWVRLAKQLLK